MSGKPREFWLRETNPQGPVHGIFSHRRDSDATQPFLIHAIEATPAALAAEDMLAQAHLAMSFLLEPAPNVGAAKRALLAAIAKAEGR